MFVTWKTKADNELRGCIGTTSPINLIEGLRKYSIISALQDGRFDPIRAAELESLICSISLLTDFEKCKRFDDWIIGVHGVSIKFKVDEKLFHALFLPEVMIEHSTIKKYSKHFLTSLDFNHLQTLENLIRKSGCKAEITKELIDKIEVTRFQSRKSSVEVTKYIQIRNKNHASA